MKKESGIGLFGILLVTAIIGILAAFVIAALISDKKTRTLEFVVLVEDLNGTIEKFNTIDVPSLNRTRGNLPDGLFEKIIADGKGKESMKIGKVMRSKSFNGDILVLLSIEKQLPCIVWKEKEEDGKERVWLFLERGADESKLTKTYAIAIAN